MAASIASYTVGGVNVGGVTACSSKDATLEVDAPDGGGSNVGGGGGGGGGASADSELI